MQACPYDAIYKAFCSDRVFVKSLLLDFVKLPFVADFDFDSLTPIKANYATPAFSRHENDLIWLVKLNGRECIIFLMLEFQSRSDKWMALRIANYATLLLEELVAHPKDNIPLRMGLPPLLPIVIYNGESRWHAASDLSALFMQMPDGLLEFQTAQKYFLLDVRHMAANLVKGAKGNASFLVRLERAQNSEDVMTVMQEIIQACPGPEYDHFRRLIYNFLLCCLERKSWSDNLTEPMPMEDFKMAYSNYPKWAADLHEGRKRAREEGWSEGLKEGLREGLKDGRDAGLKEGRSEERAAIFGELLVSLKTKLAERFGRLPDIWVEPLAQVSEPGGIMDLMGAAYTANSPQEFEAKLMQVVKK